jgi:lysozyme
MTKNQSSAGRKAWPVVIGSAFIAAMLAMFDKSEKLVLDPYFDSVGALTVCRGLTNAVAPSLIGRTIVLGERWTRDECIEGETRALIVFNARLRQCTDAAPVTMFELFAWLHFGWNIGPTQFCASTAAQLLRERRNDEACDQILRWQRAGGRDCRVRSNGCYGIVVRRTLEHTICKGEFKVPGLPPIPFGISA